MAADASHADAVQYHDIHGRERIETTPRLARSPMAPHAWLGSRSEVKRANDPPPVERRAAAVPADPGKRWRARASHRRLVLVALIVAQTLVAPRAIGIRPLGTAAIFGFGWHLTLRVDRRGTFPAARLLGRLQGGLQFRPLIGRKKFGDIRPNSLGHLIQSRSPPLAGGNARNRPPHKIADVAALFVAQAELGIPNGLENRPQRAASWSWGLIEPKTPHDGVERFELAFLQLFRDFFDELRRAGSGRWTHRPSFFRHLGA